MSGGFIGVSLPDPVLSRHATSRSILSRPEYYYFKDFHITYNKYCSMLDDILNNFTHADGCPSICPSVCLSITSGKCNSS